EQYRTPLPWAMAAAPLALGIGTAVTTGNPLGLLLGVVSPLMVIVNSLVQRRNNARRGNRTLQRWQEDKAAADAKLAEITDVERARAWRDLPSPVTVAQIATGPSARLWERRITDPDALLVRLGVAAREVPVKVEGARRSHDPAPMMSPVPVGVDLNTAPILGVAAPRAVVRSIGRWVLLQLAVLRSPRDLRIVVLCDEDAVADWQWLRWLPHMSIDLAVAPVVLIGNTAETREQRLKELLRDIEARKSMLDDQRSVSFGSQTIVLIDGARKYRTLPGMVQILTDGPGVGVRVVALDSSRARLPEEASAEIVVDAAQPAMASLEVAGLAPLAGMLIDCVDPVTAEQAARAMAPLKPVGGDGDGGALPDTLRLIDLLDLDLDDPDWLPAQWALGGRSTRAAVGAGVDGAFLLDLKADGPHALVSGTTGAGKSEFLQSWVASLALVNRPDALNFVLVDYKGASALADCERLPHTVGLVTNLDNRETERALTSLDAELKRRELALKELGVKDVDDAWDRDPAFAARYGLARLALVIDEFAELVHELPDFVKGLVRIARVGRSLGVHLVLATQRPAGVVSAEMQSNVGLRIALRMADKENSQEVLGSTDSAFISPSTPGRGYARRGGGVALAAFQAARVAGRRRGARAETTPSVTVPPPVVRNVAWPQLGEPLDLRRVQAADDQSATDLHAVVELIRAAATRLDIPANSSPWLPALPEFIAATEVNAEVSGRRPMERSRSVTIGLQDVPAEQAQRPLTYDLETASHLLIAGSARSGRTTALRTLIAALVQQWSAAELHLYVIDFGGGLLPTVALPHAGAIVTGSEGERIERLLWRLREELTIRQGILQGGGFGDIGEQRAAAPVESRMPYLLLVIDRWEGFTSSYTFEEFQELRNLILALLREGPSVGIRLVIAGDRTLLSGHVIGFIDTRY
ncbi:MAG TPA: FtsK/SpoIIIE domain-containing protein, partial [Jatrophihabitantaceae bacterium]|nr:FtsK/SpoIIIE domain-containing protein [Jatrophihabitantaceae bacterium]